MPAPGELGRVATVLDRLVAALKVVSSLILVAMMLLTFVDVIGRYVIGAPIFGATEIISTMLALVIFSGLAIANASDRHIVVELFDARIRRLSPGVYDVVIHGFSILAMALIVYVLWNRALEAAHSDSHTIVLHLPLAWVNGLVASFASVSIVCQILGLVAGSEGQARHQMEDGK